MVFSASRHRSPELLVAAWLSVGLASTASAQEPCTGVDYVGVTIADGAVVLGTQARSVFWDNGLAAIYKPRELQWRFRAIPVDPTAGAVSFDLNLSGASARVRFPEGPERLVDLTQDILRLRNADQHRPRLPLEGDAPRPCTIGAPLQNLERHFGEFRSKRSGSTAGGAASWRFFRVEVEARLYAPVIQLSRQESILPEDFAIWDRLDAAEPGLRAQLGVATRTGTAQSAALKQIYRTYREEHRSDPATVHVFADSYPGSWLLEYWFYYPFDEGGLDEHLHDSEHVFVEVDKLGGIVRRVVGAGHGLWAPNNEFTTLKVSQDTADLPLQVIVERGKHATAPDIDKDGRFTPGVDANLYRDVGKVWGVRDATGSTDSGLRAFSAEMASGRPLEDQLRSANWLQGRKTLPARAAGQSRVGDAEDAASCGGTAPPGNPEDGPFLVRPPCYVLRALPPPSNAPVQKCAGPTTACARTQVIGHTDFRRPREILKEGYFPVVSLRVGAAFLPTANGQTLHATSTRLSRRPLVGGSVEIAAIPVWPGKRIPIPGRLGVDTIWNAGRSATGRFDGVAARYELMVSNLFSGYAGLTRRAGPDGDTTDPDAPGRNLWLTAGGGFERPLIRRMFGVVRGGLAFNNFYGLRFEVQTQVGWAWGTGHRRFGIARRVPNPFSH